jgi:hypothetical protein
VRGVAEHLLLEVSHPKLKRASFEVEPTISLPICPLGALDGGFLVAVEYDAKPRGQVPVLSSTLSADVSFAGRG